MDYESALLARILDDRDFRSVIREGINADFFYDLELRELFLFLQEHYVKHGEVPTPEYLDDLFPELGFESSDDSLPALCERVREQRIYNDLVNMIDKASELARTDPRRALEVARSAVVSTSSFLGSTDDMDITKYGEEVWRRYELLKKNKGLLGIPFPWKRLNDATAGMQGGQVIMLYGRPKSMKTWVLHVIAYCAHCHYNMRLAWVSQEMPKEQSRSRAVGLFCNVDYEALTTGQLTSRAEREFKDNLEAWAEAPPYVVTRLNGIGSAAVDEFQAKVEESEAEIAFFDAVYLSGMKWEDLVAVTRGLKRVAQDLSIPIVGTCQENRQGQTAYSDSFLQDCDVLMHIKRGKEEELNEEAVLTFPAMREARLNGFAIHAKPAYNFAEKYSIQEEEEENDPFEDEEQDEGPKRRKR